MSISTDGNAIYGSGYHFGAGGNVESTFSADPVTGKVNGYIDFRGLLTTREREATDVLNGIAYDASTDTFLITGKLWPRVFRVRFVK